MDKEKLAKELIIAAKELLADYTEDEAEEILTDMVGTRGGFELMRLWETAGTSSNGRNFWGDKKTQTEWFVKIARENNFNDKVIKFYIEEIQYRKLPKNWKKIR